MTAWNHGASAVGFFELPYETSGVWVSEIGS